MNQLEKIEYGNDLVLTTEQLAGAYECEPRRISENFKRNEDRFEEGKHFFKLEGDALAAFKDSIGDTQFADTLKYTSVLVLWTKRGASRHSKMLGTDRAWEMYDVLEETYFNAKTKPLSLEEQMAQGLQAAQKLLDQTRLELTQAKQIVNELQPKATYYDLVLQNKSTLSVTKIAKDYGKSAKWLNTKLHEYGIQYKQGDQWFLYQGYAQLGYTQSSTHVIDGEHSRMSTKWTQKGRLFIYDTLKAHGILPLIEHGAPHVQRTA